MIMSTHAPISLLAASSVTLRDVLEVFTFQYDYNTTIVVLATAILGIGTGTIGSFLLLRKRALIGDALSHATLPGVCLAFMIMVALGGTGKSLPLLLLGAAITGLLGVGAVAFIRKHTRLHDDAALGIVLSVFFGLGVALLKLATQMKGGDSAGIESFIYGKPAAMLASDLRLIIAITTLTLFLSIILFKEFTLLCFDDDYASSQGWPTGLLDGIMLLLVTLVTVVGLQAVGLILVIALLITPPAAARFWTDHLRTMTILSAIIGMISGWLGASLSALIEGLPAGAIIVVTAAAIFILSMFFGTKRGILVRSLEHWRHNRSMDHQHLLRALYELTEHLPAGSSTHVKRSDLLNMRSWSDWRLGRALRRAQRDELITHDARSYWALTEAGHIDAMRMVRNHRLWEMYLITHAAIAPSHVDRDADMIEHVLGPVMVAQLEKLLADKPTVPDSPHLI